jgi:hypothetical protein
VHDYRWRALRDYAGRSLGCGGLTMGRRAVAFTEDSVSRAIRAVKKAGVEVKTVRVEPDGSVVINGEPEEFTRKQIEDSVAGYL